MRLAAAIVVLTLTLPGGAVARSGTRAETLTYDLQSTSFCLRCASYTITLGPDGQGIFVGGRNAAAVGEHRFQATPDQVRAFADRLRRYRPKGERLMAGIPPCRQYATDQHTVDVQWQPATGRPAHLLFYGGCDMDKNRRMAAALFSAPELLPVAALIGAR